MRATETFVSFALASALAAVLTLAVAPAAVKFDHAMAQLQLSALVFIAAGVWRKRPTAAATPAAPSQSAP